MTAGTGDGVGDGRARAPATPAGTNAVRDATARSATIDAFEMNLRMKRFVNLTERGRRNLRKAADIDYQK
jgi:hypothetical protein